MLCVCFEGFNRRRPSTELSWPLRFHSTVPIKQFSRPKLIYLLFLCQLFRVDSSTKFSGKRCCEEVNVHYLFIWRFCSVFVLLRTALSFISLWFETVFVSHSFSSISIHPRIHSFFLSLKWFFQSFRLFFLLSFSIFKIFQKSRLDFSLQIELNLISVRLI